MFNQIIKTGIIITSCLVLSACLPEWNFDDPITPNTSVLSSTLTDSEISNLDWQIEVEVYQQHQSDLGEVIASQLSPDNLPMVPNNLAMAYIDYLNEITNVAWVKMTVRLEHNGTAVELDTQDKLLAGLDLGPQYMPGNLSFADDAIITEAPMVTIQDNFTYTYLIHPRLANLNEIQNHFINPLMFSDYQADASGTMTTGSTFAIDAPKLTAKIVRFNGLQGTVLKSDSNILPAPLRVFSEGVIPGLNRYGIRANEPFVLLPANMNDHYIDVTIERSNCPITDTNGQTQPGEAQYQIHYCAQSTSCNSSLSLVTQLTNAGYHFAHSTAQNQVCYADISLSVKNNSATVSAVSSYQVEKLAVYY